MQDHPLPLAVLMGLLVWAWRQLRKWVQADPGRPPEEDHEVPPPPEWDGIADGGSKVVVFDIPDDEMPRLDGESDPRKMN